MKCKVKLTHTVEMLVEGSSEDAIMDWLRSTTPIEAKQLAEQNGKIVWQDYDEEIVCQIRDDVEVDYVIKEE